MKNETKAVSFLWNYKVEVKNRDMDTMKVEIECLAKEAVLITVESRK